MIGPSFTNFLHYVNNIEDLEDDNGMKIIKDISNDDKSKRFKNIFENKKRKNKNDKNTRIK